MCKLGYFLNSSNVCTLNFGIEKACLVENTKSYDYLIQKYSDYVTTLNPLVINQAEEIDKKKLNSHYVKPSLESENRLLEESEVQPIVSHSSCFICAPGYFQNQAGACFLRK